MAVKDESVLFAQIKMTAETGRKHAQGSVCPIDRMEFCFMRIIQLIEERNGKDTARK